MAVIENDVIKVTVSNSGTKNVIRVSPGVAALASVSLSLNDLNNVDTSGITNGQTIVYDNGSFVAGDSGAVETINGVAPDGNGDVVIDFSVDGLSDVDVTTPSTGDILKYETNRWVNDSLGKADVDLANVDNTSDASKPISTATQTALDTKANTSSVPTSLNDLSDVVISGTPSKNQALVYDELASVFKSQTSYTNRFEDQVEQGLEIATIYAERGYSVKSEGDGTFIDPSSDTPTAGKVIKRKIYHKTGFISNNDVIGDYTLIHTFADDTAYADTVAVFDAFEEGATYGVPPFTLFQTWEEVTAAPSFTGLLNETYGSGAEAAYSTRRLNGLYSGDCMTIRRASDSTTQSIGFVGEEIDESAIETFCSGTTCTVQIWRDQSGNSNDAEQTTPANQPTIYTGGQLVKESGRLALEPQGFGGLVVTGLTGQANTNVFEVVLANQSPVISLDSASGQGKFPYLGWNGSSGGVGRGTNFFVDGTSQSWTTRDDAWQTLNNAQRVVSYTVDTSDYSGFALRYGLNNTAYAPIQQEVVIYSSVKSTSDRTDIEGNISAYFQSAKLLDEQYGSGAEAAYSVRQLKRDNTECMVIRRASDSTTTTIGFDGSGNIDEAAIETFCTGTTCTVSSWLDQSGNGNNATQATPANQPTIYTGGALVKENGRLALDFDGVSDNMTSVSTYTPTTSMAQAIIVKGLSSSTDQIIGDDSDRKAGMGLRIQSGNFNYFNGYTTGHNMISITADDNQNLHFYGRDTSSTFYASLNGSETSSVITAINTAAQNIYLGARHDGSLDLDGAMQEYILYLTSKSADKTSIEENIGDYFTQNTPLLDTYSGAAAAYSLRRLSSSYTGDAVEVYNGSSYANVGFNAFGELDTVALAAHCGSNDGFVSKWYSQTGSNDATQTTTANMPKIYDGTTGVVTEGSAGNEKPAVQMASNSINLSVPNSKATFKFLHDGSSSSTSWVVSPTDARETSGTTQHELLETGEFTSSVGVEINYSSSQYSNTEYARFLVKNGTGAPVDYTTPAGTFAVGQNLATFYIDADNATAADRLKVGLNSGTLLTGNTQTAAPSAADSQFDFTIYGGFTAHWQEVIVWNSDESSNRTGIEANINTFYSIY